MTSHTGGLFRNYFSSGAMLTYVFAAHAMWRAVRMNKWSPCVCPDSGKVAKGALAGDQTKVKGVLPSDWPHVFCQGQLPVEERFCWYQRQATWSESNCHRFPVHLAQGNICPSHWAESNISSRHYLKEWGWWDESYEEWSVTLSSRQAHHWKEDEHESKIFFVCLF